MKHVINVVMLESRMEDHALEKPASTAFIAERPILSSSFIRSKIKIFASTAIPTDRMNPPIAASVNVTGISLKRASVMIA